MSGAGPPRGWRCRDAVAVGALRAEGLDFAEVSSFEWAPYRQKPWDGVVGLCLGEDGGAPPLLRALAEAGRIAEPAFAFFLGPGPSRALGPPST